MPQTIADLIAAWAPFVAILGVMLLYTRLGGLRVRAPSGRTMIELYELQLDEMKRNAAALERIATALERRSG